MDQRVSLLQERVSVVGDLLAVLKDQLSHTHGKSKFSPLTGWCEVVVSVVWGRYVLTIIVFRRIPGVDCHCVDCC